MVEHVGPYHGDLVVYQEIDLFPIHRLVLVRDVRIRVIPENFERRMDSSASCVNRRDAGGRDDDHRALGLAYFLHVFAYRVCLS